MPCTLTSEAILNDGVASVLLRPFLRLWADIDLTIYVMVPSRNGGGAGSGDDGMTVFLSGWSKLPCVGYALFLKSGLV